MDHSWHSQLQQFLREHSGIIPIAQLIEFGCRRHQAYQLGRSPDFELVMPGILHSTHWPMGPAHLAVAACLRDPLASIAYTTAAQDWRFRGIPRDDDVYVLVPHGHKTTLPGVIVRQCRSIDPADIVTRANGTRVTSPTRTLFDCADRFGAKRTTSILEQLINDEKGLFVTHATTCARLADPRREGTRTMTQVIAARPAWRRAMQSELEVLVLNEIQRARLPAPEVQLPFLLPNGTWVVLDFAWPAHRAALEVDHPFWHAGATSVHRDKRRDLKMATVGWQTMRITDLDVEGALRPAIADVAAALALRPTA